MATRSLRRGLGVRVLLTSALLVALVAASLPAHALISPVQVSSSVQSGYAANTVLLPDHVGLGAKRPFDQSDPPYQNADGEIRSVVSRWGVTLCQAPTSTATLTGALGAIAGTATTEDFKKAPNKVIRFTVNDPTRPHGLIAGDSPLTVTWTAVALQPDGSCGGSVTSSETFLLDRNIPDVPVIDSPSWVLGVSPCGARSCDIDKFRIAEPQSGDVIVSGTVSDPLTFPFEDQEPDKWYETSGIKAVVVRLSSGEFCGFAFCGDTFLGSYSQEFACTDVNENFTAGIQRCADTPSYSITIPAEDLIPSFDYAIDVYAVDVAGYRSPVLSTQPTNSDNQNGQESNPVTFVYTG